MLLMPMPIDVATDFVDFADSTNAETVDAFAFL
jgi:hypothetical protein